MALCWSFLLSNLLAVGTLAFAPAPLRWGGLAARRFVLAPKVLEKSIPVSNMAIVPPLKLAISEQPSKILSDMIPAFTARSDKTIVWESADLCLEASGKRRGEAINVNRCSGGPTQQWIFLPYGAKKSLIQLKATNLCMAVHENRGNLSGAAVELHDCEHKLIESWRLEEPIPLPSQGQRKMAGSSLMHHVLVSLILSVVAGTLMLRTWLRRWQSEDDGVGCRPSTAPLALGQGGVSLDLPLRPHDNMGGQGGIPATMMVSPQTSEAPDDVVWTAVPLRGQSKYVRVQRTTASIKLQTAVERLSFVDKVRNVPFEVHLLSTVHLAEKSYYESIQRLAEGDYDRVLFELITDESLVEEDASGTRRLREDLQPSPTLARLAEQNELSTQIDELDLKHDERWVLADVSRAQLSEKQREFGVSALFADVLTPLSSLLSSGPPNFRQVPRSFLRLLLFAFVPAPEVALLLDDWIASGGVMFGAIIVSLANAISRFDFRAASRLSFAQTLASGDTTQQGTVPFELVRWRNECAVAEVDRALDAGCSRVALLYGSLHMRDLRRKLASKYCMMGGGSKQWITAWSIPVPEKETAPRYQVGRAQLQPFFVPGIALVALLAIDGFDWASFLRDFAILLGASPLASGLGMTTDMANPTDAAIISFFSIFSMLFYFGRHVLLYLALERWVFEWDTRLFAVEKVRLQERASIESWRPDVAPDARND